MKERKTQNTVVTYSSELLLGPHRFQYHREPDPCLCPLTRELRVLQEVFITRFIQLLLSVNLEALSL